MGIYKAKVLSSYNKIYDEIIESALKVKVDKKNVECQSEDYVIEVKVKTNSDQNKAISSRNRNNLNRIESIVIG